ncbi:MAG: MBL fold metallo-hydrolase [Cyclobacteriaceae bacterium]|nr:MBL fold metallo-hydrolase [Cyclobacteriaceae bacterium]MCH8517648.1 MBL fold metallo-hydrolase [Cyclobacteriaceae bacterium]
MKIHTLDHHFHLPELIASYLIETDEGLILMEAGPDSTFPNIKKQVELYGFKLSDINAVFLTHIHLDHAGAAWRFANEGAKIYVHPRGKKHLIDPSRLLKSAKKIYKDQMDSLWGEMRPIDSDLIYALKDEEVIDIIGLQVEAHDSPGHAYHHYAYRIGEHLFSGDVGGYQIKTGPVIAPTPPPDIDIEAWQSSLDRLIALECKHIYPTHYGKSILNANDFLEHCRQNLLFLSSKTEEVIIQSTSKQEAIDQFEIVFMKFLKDHIQDESLLKQYLQIGPSLGNFAGLAFLHLKKLGLSLI